MRSFKQRLPIFKFKPLVSLKFAEIMHRQYGAIGLGDGTDQGIIAHDEVTAFQKIELTLGRPSRSVALTNLQIFSQSNLYVGICA